MTKTVEDRFHFFGGRIENVPLSDIVLDRATQIRVDMCEETIQRYFDAMEDEQALGKFPPIRLIRDSDEKLWLADGHHRVVAAVRRKFESIPGGIRPGTKADAIWEAAKANGKNGLQLGRADIRRAVEMILTVLPDRSNRAVAEVVGCSHEYVRKLRQSTGNSLTVERTIGKDGKSRPAYQRNKKKPPEETAPENVSDSPKEEHAGKGDDADLPLREYAKRTPYDLLHAILPVAPKGYAGDLLYATLNEMRASRKESCDKFSDHFVKSHFQKLDEFQRKQTLYTLLGIVFKGKPQIVTRIGDKIIEEEMALRTKTSK